MLDTDLPENSLRDRAITDRLYSGDQEHRLRQELVLGVGGARALTALGIAPRTFHLNEGHAGLLILELLSGYLASGLSLKQAVAAARPLTLFTTHTPVPAGIDRFPRPLFERYVGRVVYQEPRQDGRALCSWRAARRWRRSSVQHGRLLPQYRRPRQRGVATAR